MSSVNPIYNEDGTLAGGGDGDHPLAISSADAGYQRSRDKFVNAQVHAKWSVPTVKGLKIGVMANYRDGDGWGKLWEKNVPLYMQDGSVQPQPTPALTVDSYYSKRLYFETSASYSNTFGKHGVEGAYAAAKIDGKYIGAPDRASSYQSNTWEYVNARKDKNYTYYIPIDESVIGKSIEVFVMGYDKENLDLNPDHNNS